MLAAIAHALMMSLTMAWEILWALILGFWLSAVIQAVVSKEEMSRLLPDDSPKTIAIACGLGAASSSCSYAAVALARSMFRKGANFTAAMAFQFASTNLVLELGILLAVLMGWQFTLAEFTGGPIMIIILVLLFKVFLTPRLVEAARTQADKGIQGRMEGHAGMDMSIHEGTIWQRMISAKGRTAISHFFVMDWASLGAEAFLAGFLLCRSSIARKAVGTAHWPARRYSFLCLLGRKCAACSGVVERRHQLRWRRGVPLRRSHHPADSRYLSQVLLAQGQHISACRLLRFDGCRRAARRVFLRHASSHSPTEKRADDGGGDPMELHYLARHCLSDRRAASYGPLPADRWPRDAPHDE
jgi:hypothetical protein